MAKPVRLPVVPLAQPIQLVLGLDGVGIEKPRKRRARRTPSPWLPVANERVA
jgi:hypothetical protein